METKLIFNVENVTFNKMRIMIPIMKNLDMTVLSLIQE